MFLYRTNKPPNFGIEFPRVVSSASKKITKLNSTKAARWFTNPMGAGNGLGLDRNNRRLIISRQSNLNLNHLF